MMKQEYHLYNAMERRILIKNLKRKKSISILIIEHNHIIQYGYLSLFEHLPCHITMASTGVEAMQQVKQHLIQQPFDLILSEIGLPDISGIELCKTIRKLEGSYRHYTPILAVSYQADEKRNECLVAGYDQVIDKLMSTELVSSIERWLLWLLE